jgi:hypothetical protein
MPDLEEIDAKVPIEAEDHDEDRNDSARKLLQASALKIF